MQNKEPIYVVGFPKSGNTWLARLISETLDSNLAPNNSIDAADFSENRKGKYIIFKEHTDENIYNIPKSSVIYIVRDVRDVLVSGFFHGHQWCDKAKISNSFFIKSYFLYHVRKLNKKWQGSAWEELKQKIIGIIKYFIQSKAQKKRIGNWSNHVKFWENQPNVIVVRYEDLLNYAEAELEKIFILLNIKINIKKLRDVVKNQSFEKKKSDFIKLNDLKNSQFLRNGKEGGWKIFLPQTLVKEIEQSHIEVLNRYGYETNNFEGR